MSTILNPSDSAPSSVPMPEQESALLPDFAPEESVAADAVREPRRMRPLRFASGLMLTTAGVCIILTIGVQALEVRQLGGDFALVLVAFGVLSGVVLLGGGFGLMATASAGFDEREFDQLMRAGNISSTPAQCHSSPVRTVACRKAARKEIN